MHLKFSTSSIFGFAIVVLFFSCNNNKEENKQTNQEAFNNQETNTPEPPSFSSKNLAVKTFEIKDTVSGKSLGWGYDIIIDGHTSIHQPIIPGVSGNQSFSTEDKALTTGTFAINKMKQTGGLPTITIEELDSLGVTK